MKKVVLLISIQIFNAEEEVFFPQELSIQRSKQSVWSVKNRCWPIS